MRVLAFDPGFERLGVAVLERQRGRDVLLHSDCIRTSAKAPFADRLRTLGGRAEALIRQYCPECVALEEIYFEKNAKTAIGVAGVRGVLAYLGAKNTLPVHYYTPLQVKIAITGYGKSDKKAIASMLPRLITLPPGRRLDDEFDAIAVGLTCLSSGRFPQ